MTESEYAYCDLCNRGVKKAECKRVSITTINLIKQEGADTERTIVYACTCSYPALKLAFIDAVPKVLDAVGSKGY
jgi:hypothetical protein